MLHAGTKEFTGILKWDLGTLTSCSGCSGLRRGGLMGVEGLCNILRSLRADTVRRL